jgi:dTDP-4-dehydrorhamnose 3,5-epimerase
LALEENTAVAYLVSTPYSPDHEFEINPLDLSINISWKMESKVLKISEKDKGAPDLLDLKSINLLPTWKKKNE